MAIYGVDLGTTFCSVAYAARGVAVVVPLESGPTLASTVLLDGRAAPRAVVGREATRIYRALCAGRGEPPPGVVLVRGSKNHVGTAGAVTGGPPWALGGDSLGPTDVAALVLRALVERVRRTPGLPAVDGVVVTHPQRFRNRERRATAQAVYLAGLRPVALVPEPDAAAYAYGLHHRGRAATFMVFDFGGGTLDVTVMRSRAGAHGGGAHGGGVHGGGALEALASYGVQLGGLGIDESLRDRLLERYAVAVGRPDLSLDALSESAREELLATAEGVKIQLNVHATGDVNPSARVTSRALALETAEGECLPRASVRVTLGELSGWTAETVERAADCGREALARAGLAWGDLDDVLLVGGSSWLHPVQDRLRALSGGRVRLYDDAAHPLNPATAVAAGAALYAEGIRDGSAEVDYHGVIPDAFGVRARTPDPEREGAWRETLAVLVPALTRVPFEGRRTFRKRGTAQVLPVEVLEGRTLAEATPVGRFLVALDRDLPDGAPVEVTLRIGRDGVLGLEVRDPRSGAAREVTLTDAEGIYSDEAIDARKALLATVDLA